MQGAESRGVAARDGWGVTAARHRDVLKLIVVLVVQFCMLEYVELYHV